MNERIVVGGTSRKLFQRSMFDGTCGDPRCTDPDCDGSKQITSECGETVYAVFHPREAALGLYCPDCGGCIGVFRIAEDRLA